MVCLEVVHRAAEALKGKVRDLVGRDGHPASLLKRWFEGEYPPAVSSSERSSTAMRQASWKRPAAATHSRNVVRKTSGLKAYVRALLKILGSQWGFRVSEFGAVEEPCSLHWQSLIDRSNQT